MKKVCSIAVCVVLVLSLGCGENRSNKEFWYKYGADEAANDISKNLIYDYEYGLRDNRNNISPESGIIIKTVGGCLVDDKIEGLASGYNDAIRKWQKNGGKPVNTYADYKSFVCGDERDIIKTWESSPCVEISGRYRDDSSDLEIEVRRKKLENIKIKDVYIDVIEIRNDGRFREQNPAGTTDIKNVKMRRNASVPYLLYFEADFITEGKLYRNVMIYDFREMMILRYFSQELS